MAPLTPPRSSILPSASRFGTPFRDADCEAEEIMDGKLAQLIEIGGYASLEDLLTAVVSDSVAPGICVREGCSYPAKSSRIRTQAGAKLAAGKVSAPRSFLPASYRRPR